MGNEQQGGGTSHHFVSKSPNDDNHLSKHNNVLWTKNGRIPASKQQPTAAKASWEMARDVSMDILSRKATKLNMKQGPTPNLIGHRSVLKKYPSQVTPAPGKPLPVYRIPRMPNEKEVADITIAYQLLCEFCDGPCIGDYVRCRVCIKTYHSECLYKRGHVSEQSFSLPRLGKQDWSCPECRDLTRLLTQDEVNYLIFIFEQMDRNKDYYISMEDFLAFHSNRKIFDNFNLFTENKDDTGKLHFNLMDSKQKGSITWPDFALFYTCKLLAGKNKTQLATKLTIKELVLAKNLFLKDPRLKIDKDSNIVITKDHFNRVFYDLTLLLKKKYGGDFVDAILYENQNIDEIIEKFSVFGWDDFLRQITVPIIMNRKNYDLKNSQLRRASIIMPNHPVKATFISHINLTGTEIDSTKKVLTTTTLSPDFSFDGSFRKHSKILEKLDRRRQEEELKRKKLGSSLDWTVLENIDDEEISEVPRLKPSARDERQTITDPWSVVKDMQHLRKEPILITTTRIQMLKV